MTQRGNSFKIVFAANYKRSKLNEPLHHLSINEREKLLVLQMSGAGICEISREQKRNSEAQAYWPSAAATERYKIRHQASRRKRKLNEPERRAFVQRMILENQ